MTELRVFTSTIMGSVPATFYWALGILFLVGGIYFYLKNNANVNGNVNEKYSYNAFQYWGRAVARLLLVEWIILVLGIAVIFREPRAERSFCLIPFSSYFDYGTNSYFMEKTALNILNVVLFLPVGLLLGFMVHGSWFTVNERRWLWVMVVGCGLSVLIEVLQFVFKRGLCEVDDVIHNVLGCMIGYGVARLVGRNYGNTELRNHGESCRAAEARNKGFMVG